MSRLELPTPSKAQLVVEGLYKDLERRIEASPPGLCPVDISRAFLERCHAQTCGKCVPCRIGLLQLKHLITDVLNGKATMETLDLMERTARSIMETADCAIGYEAANMVYKGLIGYREDYEEHIRNGRCTCTYNQPVPCVALCPAHVDIPGYIALVREGRYADAIRLIRKDNPFPTTCGFICEHPCEARCRRNMVDDAVNIRGLKRMAADYAGKVPPPECAPSTGKTVAVIGGGPAGLAAAVAAKRAGAEDILILERDSCLGGILNQCIHNGFGLHTFKEELTGPEYAARYIDMVEEEKIPYKLNTMVIDINQEKEITVINREDGLQVIRAKAIILAMGCRERPRGALNIPGYRPAGIYSAGTAQRLMNIEGFSVGREVVILGSGDIGLIMARRMTLEGAKVKVVAELMPYSGGLKRNIVQCLDDYGIPLKLSHTVIDIQGKERVTGITLARVDENRKPIPGTEEHYSCDTLLLSVGLIPENELTKGIGASMNRVTQGPNVNDQLETDTSGVFACGNVLHVHDLVDYVSEEATLAGANAAAYVGAESEKEAGRIVALKAENGVRYTVPQAIDIDHMKDKVTVRFRVADVYKDRFISVYYDGVRVSKKKKKVLAPGEMEQVVLKKESFSSCPDLKNIVICTEVE